MIGRRTPAWVLALTLLALLLTGCGLPLADGTRSADEDVPAEERPPPPIIAIPPGPQDGASPEEVVRGFLRAQGSPRDDHEVARSFLLPAEGPAWDDDARALVYEGAPRVSARADGGDALVTVRVAGVGLIGADGAAADISEPEARSEFRLRQDADQQWRIVELDDGLILTTGDRDRSYTPTDVHFLSQAPSSRGDTHLVPDRVLLLNDGSRPERIVQRLLAGPSSGLGSSARSAVPSGTRLASPVTTRRGEVTVDLTGEVAGLGEQARRDLSAQLCWSLRQDESLSRLRLLVEGEPLAVDGRQEPQQVRTDWAGHDPAGRGPADAVTVVAGALRVVPVSDDGASLGVPRRPGEAAAGLTGLSEAIADPRTGELAMLQGSGPTTVLTGPASGPFRELASPGQLLSPSWGDGAHGLWLLRRGQSGVQLLRRSGELVRIAVPGRSAETRRGDVLRLSRDGARVALVQGGQLLLGRVEAGADGPPRLTALSRRVIGPPGERVLDVAWTTGTQLAVLVESPAGASLPRLKEVAVDGTSVLARSLGVEAPVSLTAFGEQPLLVAASPIPGSTAAQPDRPATTYVGRPDEGLQPLRLAGVSRPRYPG